MVESIKCLAENLPIKAVSRKADSRIYKVVAAVPGTIGYDPQGKYKIIYTKESHRRATLVDVPILDMNHVQPATVGRVIGKEVDSEGNLILEFEVDAKYPYINQILDENVHDGVSIEAAVTDYTFDEERQAYIAHSYVLTGLAIMLAMPSSCPKSKCKLTAISADLDALLHSTTINKEGTFMTDTVTTPSTTASTGDMKITFSNSSAPEVKVEAPVEAPKETPKAAVEAPKVEASAPATPVAAASTVAPVTPPAPTPNKVEAEALRKEMSEHKAKMEAAMADSCKAFEAKIAMLEAQSMAAVKAKEEAETKLAGAQKELTAVSGLLGEYKARVLSGAKALITPKVLDAISTVADIKADAKLEDIPTDKLLKVISFAEKATALVGHSTEGAGATETNKPATKPKEEKRDPLQTKVGWLTKVLEQKRAEDEKKRLEAIRAKRLREIEEAEAKNAG